MNSMTVIAFAAAALTLTGCDQPKPVRPVQVVSKQHIRDDQCLLLGGICLDAVPTFDMR